MLKKGSDARNERFQLLPAVYLVTKRLHRGAKEAFFVGNRDDFAALHALDQHLYVAVGQLQALHNIGHRADLVNFVRARFVHRSVVLGGQKDLFVASQGVFESPNARIATHNERGHHVGENDDVPNGHHGQALGFRLFLRCDHVDLLDDAIRVRVTYPFGWVLEYFGQLSRKGGA